MGKEVVVIGGGINGLVASYYLQDAGFKVLVLEKKVQVGGACVAETVAMGDKKYTYPLGATVLGSMQRFVFEETGLVKRLETYLPKHPSIVSFQDLDQSAYLYRDPDLLETEFRDKWREFGDLKGYLQDKSRVVSYLQKNYRSATPPSLQTAEEALGKQTVDMWIKGKAADLLNHYFTSDYTKIIAGLPVVESGSVSINLPYSAFNIALVSSGGVFGGFWGYVKGGLWQIPIILDQINQEEGVQTLTQTDVKEAIPDKKQVLYERLGHLNSITADAIIFATDPLTAAKLVRDEKITERILSMQLLGTSGKLLQIFRRPVDWKNTGLGYDYDTALRFFINSSSLEEFDTKTLSVTQKEKFTPHQFQVYPDGAAQNRLGLNLSYDYLAVFFKDLALSISPAEKEQIHRSVNATMLSHIKNPEDLVFSKLLLPQNLRDIFYFPQGNIDHTQLTQGQNFSDRTFSQDPKRTFYQFGDHRDIYYCGAGAYPGGSVAGTAGYICAKELIRNHR